MSSEGIADDTKIELDDNGKVYEVSGTHTYQTALGAQRTVMVLEPFDMEAVVKFLANEIAKEKEKGSDQQ